MKHLRNKGWTHHEIQKAEDILHSEQKKKKHIMYKKEMSRLLYWMTLLVLIVCNFLASFFLIPFLVLMNASFIYFIAALMGFVFGLLFNLLVSDIEHLEPKHHLIAIVTIPVIGIVDLFLMIGISNAISEVINVYIKQDPFMVSVFYVIPFLLPYLYTTLTLRK